MGENYIVINGKKAELTAEQLKALGLKREIKSNPFKKKITQSYCYIDGTGEVIRLQDVDCFNDKQHFKVANYCTNREIMQQQAYRETLNRLLWRYSMEHGGDEIDWNNHEQSK